MHGLCGTVREAVKDVWFMRRSHVVSAAAFGGSGGMSVSSRLPAAVADLCMSYLTATDLASLCVTNRDQKKTRAIRYIRRAFTLQHVGDSVSSAVSVSERFPTADRIGFCLMRVYARQFAARRGAWAMVERTRCSRLFATDRE